MLNISRLKSKNYKDMIKGNNNDTTTNNSTTVLCFCVLTRYI